ncbi:hypothetical protein ED312_23365, partial [Sinomicrobium pectinilyticum]
HSHQNMTTCKAGGFLRLTKKLPNSESRIPVPEKTYHPQINPFFFPVRYFRFLVRINSVSLLRDIFFQKNLPEV